MVWPLKMDFRSLSRLNGERAVSLVVRRQSGTNLLAVADAVKAQLNEIRQSFPEGFEIILAQDLSVFVAQSVDEAQSELFRGGVLAVLVTGVRPPGSCSACCCAVLSR